METEKLILDGSKVLWHKERIEQWRNGERFAPITIDCALTTRCSYRCIYCYGKMQCINQSENMDEQTILHFLEDAAEIGVKAISFVSDGESTCNPHLKKAIVYGKSLGLDMALGTNGFLLKDEELEDILPCLTYLRFNISAGERDRYAYIHGCKQECYDKVVETMKQAVKIRNEKKLPVTIGMQMVLMPEFADQILPLTNLGREIGVDYLVIKHCSDDEDGTLGVDYEKYNDIICNINNKNAIDLGCGLGQDSIWLFERGFNVISCDFSEKATNKFKAMYPNANIMNFDIVDGLPFESNSVGLINANLSIHYFDMNKTMEIFDSIYKTLERGGLFIGRVNSDKNEYVNDDYIKVEENFYYNPVKEQHKRLFNQEQFDKLTKNWNEIILNENETTRKGRKKYTWEFILQKY